MEDKEIKEETPKTLEDSEVEENKTKVLETVVLEKPEDVKKKKRQEKIDAIKKERIEKKLKKERQKALKKGPQTIVRFDTDTTNGLSQSIVEQRINEGLVNNSNANSSKSIPKIIIGNVFTFFNMLTLAIGIWLMTVGAFTDLLFLVIVTVNVILGCIQEIRAKLTIDRLSLISAPTAIVVRDGIQKEVKVTEVVLDDLLLLENGKQICADSIVVEGAVEVNESLLTGESDSIPKKPGDILYSGSYVVSGKCKSKVDKVGKDNYIETLTSQAKRYKKPNSDLMNSLNLIIRVMAVVIIPIGGWLFYMQLFQNGADYVTAVRKTAGAMIGMIPSGLFLLTSVALYLSVIRLGKNNVLVHELYCIEMLARVNTICLDKTGTITDGTMSIKNVIEYNSVGGLSTRNIVSAILNALNDQNLTSKALEEHFGLSKRIKHTAAIPFSSQRKYQAVTFEKYGTFALGAPEFILKNKYKVIESEVNNYAKSGYRVLLLAHIDGTIENEELPSGDIEVVSLILIEDNVRPDAIKTIDYFKKSGVDVKVISGDNPITVSKISERAGINRANEYISLDGMEDEDVIRAASKYTVFGRVSPAQKRLLVHTLKEEGKIVAMTGDGVNDILALREADCSIAVASGSEAARNVSHLVLMDSNFDSMPKVVSEGRRVINNVANVASLFLTKTIFSFLLAIQALQSGGIYPISTLQLLIIDVFCIAIPSFFLVFEPNNKEVGGNFLLNIIKGALPGALVILVCSTVVFGLVDSLNLKFIDSSTIIVISATHTCMCVLFRVCRPFNWLRRLLCVVMYTIFILVVLLLPSVLEFSPITKFSEYYSEKLKIETPRNLPKIAISKDGYYVIDGMVTEYPAPINNGGNYTFSSKNIDGRFYLVVNGTETNYLIKTPTFTIANDLEYIANGFATAIDYSNEYKLVSDLDGNVYVDSINPNNQTHYNVMPNVLIGSDGNYVVNDITTEIQGVKEILSVGITEDFKLIINGEVINYQIDIPNISRNNDNKLVVGGYNSNVYASNIDDFTDNVTLDAGTYMIDGVKSKLSIGTISEIAPKLDTSHAGYYILDGRYTQFKIAGDRTKISITIDSDGYYAVNGVKIDIKAVVEYSYGGTVKMLETPAFLLLATLCLMAAPLMRFFEAIVPWVRKQYYNIQSLIAKM